MKVLLIQPPVCDFYETPIRNQPIGLCSLKAAVEQFLPGVRVVVRDYRSGYGRKSIALPEELEHLRCYYPFPDQSPFSTFYHFYHFGADLRFITEDAAARAPDIVGISSLFSPYFKEVLQTAAAVKERLNVPVFVGGSHASACPEMMLSDPNIDYLIRGEGERPLVELLRCLQDGGDLRAVPNLGFKYNGSLVLNPLADNYPIDELPAPDLSDLNPEHYLYEKKPLGFVVTSRGCPYQCSFCSVHQTFGHVCRRRNPANVILEIKKRYLSGVRVFDFEDDNLAGDRGAFKTLCEGLIAEFAGCGVRFTAMNGILYRHLDRELLSLMKTAGFQDLNISLVSADQHIAGSTKRTLSLNKYVEVAAAAHELGFRVVSYQILGLPGDALEQMIQTLVFNTRLPVLLGASPFYLVPGSPISTSFPLPTSQDLVRARLTALGIETEEFTRDDIYTLFVTTRIVNFLKSFKFDDVSLTLPALLAEKKTDQSRVKLGKQILKRLFTKQRLYGFSRAAFEELPRFRWSLFEKFWRELPVICTQQGRIIHSLEP
ncbi:MAG TPA: radical SAM protein [Oligoflexia bacterium]|nr:radical SAM protein [Oligoflexia bacterium]